MEKLSIINLNENPPPNIDPNIFAELEINQILRIKSIYLSGRLTSFNVSDYFITDPETITHRLNIFEDLLNINEICDLFVEILPILCDMYDFSGKEYSGAEYNFLQYFYYLIKLEMYVDCINKMQSVFKTVSIKVKSKGINGFINHIAEVSGSEDFKNLQKNLADVNKSVKNIKSVTIGINLDEQLRMDDFGIISLNQEKYKSGNLLDKILRADFSKNDQYTYITPLTPVFDGLTDEQKITVNNSFKSSFDALLKKSLRGVQFGVDAYIKNNIKYLLDLIPEICFLIAGVEYLNELKEKGVTICKPQVSRDKSSRIRGLINPHLLKSVKNIVANDIEFDDTALIYILTGANSGGKSVFVYSVGIAQVLFQLGLFIPAKEAVLSPVENILVHFPIKNVNLNSKGRLEQEFMLLNSIKKDLTPKSLVLMDETFSSTSAIDGAALAEDFLQYISSVGCKCIFSTHLHELALNVNSLDKTDNLVAETKDGMRTYNILRKAPEGKSYAQDIAKKYGFLKED